MVVRCAFLEVLLFCVLVTLFAFAGLVLTGTLEVVSSLLVLDYFVFMLVVLFVFWRWVRQGK